MVVTKNAVAGTLESSDCMVTVEPAGEVTVEVRSVVYRQFGEDIERSVRQVLENLGITGGLVRVNDMGAVDWVIRARLETAIRRSGREGEQ